MNDDERGPPGGEADVWRARFEAERLTRLAAEAELQAAAREQSLVEARRAELEGLLAAERQRHAAELEASRRAAAEAGQAKTAFLASMSHEIRTPLAAVVGYANLIAAVERADPDAREWGKRLQRSAEHLLALLDDVLDLAKIESGKLDLHLVPSDPAWILEEVGVLMEPRAVEKGLELVVVAETELPERLRTDPLRLRQILVNLVGNALKYTARGRVDVHARLRTSPIGRSITRTFEVEVSDTGVGIPAGELERLFEPFEQGTSRPRAGGVGLGLGIARRLARMLGGDVGVRSELGRGSTFTLSLPVDAGADRAMSPARVVTRSGALRPEEPEPPRLDGLTVLVVDDAEDNRRISAHFLKTAGARVHEAATLAAARRILAAAEAVDLVLCDVQLPDGDGLELVQERRAQGDARPVIALTADALLETRERAMAAGVTDFLVKPVVAWRLISRVAAVAKRLGAAPVAEPRPQPAPQPTPQPTPQTTPRPGPPARGHTPVSGAPRPALRRIPTLPTVAAVQAARPEGAGDAQRTPTAPNARPEVVDERLRPEVPVELLARFYGMLSERVYALDEALRGRDRARARDVAHRVAGSGATMGHPELTELGRHLEQAVVDEQTRGGSWEEIERRGARLLVALREATTRRPWLR